MVKMICDACKKEDANIKTASFVHIPLEQVPWWHCELELKVEVRGVGTMGQPINGPDLCGECASKLLKG